MLKNWNNLCYGKKSIFFIPDLLVWSFMSCRVLPRLNVNDIKKKLQSHFEPRIRSHVEHIIVL